MRKNILLIVLGAAIFVFVWGAISNSAKAADDPVGLIRNAKTPVHLHSLAGGTICGPYSDSLVHDLPSMVDTWWHSIYPPGTYSHIWHVIDERDNGIPRLNPSDKLKIEHVPDGIWIWVHVVDVTITLILTLEPYHEDTMYVEFDGWNTWDTAFVDSAILPPVVCDTLHEIWPVYCNRYHLSRWIDNGNDSLDCCDTINLVKLGTQDTTWWHVEDVAIDILVQAIFYFPTMTQWGVIVLALLIVASAIFILLRRRRVTVPA